MPYDYLFWQIRQMRKTYIMDCVTVHAYSIIIMRLPLSCSKLYLHNIFHKKLYFVASSYL